MAKGDYPTSALVEVLRETSSGFSTHSLPVRKLQRFHHRLYILVKLDAAQQSVDEDLPCAKCGGDFGWHPSERCGEYVPVLRFVVK